MLMIYRIQLIELDQVAEERELECRDTVAEERSRHSLDKRIHIRSVRKHIGSVNEVCAQGVYGSTPKLRISWNTNSSRSFRDVFSGFESSNADASLDIMSKIVAVVGSDIETSDVASSLNSLIILSA